MSDSSNVTVTIDTPNGRLTGVRRDHGAAFLGVPFAEPPVGELRFAAPRPVRPWEGTRRATTMGATPQRRPLADVTVVPEPSVPGGSTLNVNVFTPRPGDREAKLPVLVWIHGGGFVGGSPASPWYDGRAFNRDGVVTVSVSYRLGFDGFGWMEDAPLNRGTLDQVCALAWVSEQIEAFGGDPQRVTIAGQSAGGASVLTLLACPSALPRFAAAICHSGTVPNGDLAGAQRAGLALAERAGVRPTRGGWDQLDENQILDLQADVPGPDPLERVRALVHGDSAELLRWSPVWGDDLLPHPIDGTLTEGAGARKPLLIGSAQQEFTDPSDHPDGLSVAARATAVSERVGLAPEAATRLAQTFPELDLSALTGQVMTEFLFRIPTLTTTRRGGPTWLYDFRWVSGSTGGATHCVELPFVWDLLDAPGVPQALGPRPDQRLADRMHDDWVNFVTRHEVDWAHCEDTPDLKVGRPGMVFDTDSRSEPAPYLLEAELPADQTWAHEHLPD